MFPRILVANYTKSYRGLVLKVGIPFGVTIAATFTGFAQTIVMALVLFSTITGTGMSMVSFKMNGMFDRLVISPISKPFLFFQYLITYDCLYMLQYLPTLAVLLLISPIGILPPFILTIMFVTVVGTLIGMHADGLGSLHLYSMLCIIPLMGIAFISTPVSFFFPFIYVISPPADLYGLLIPAAVLTIVHIIALYSVSNL